MFGLALKHSGVAAASAWAGVFAMLLTGCAVSQDLEEPGRGTTDVVQSTFANPPISYDKGSHELEIPTGATSISLVVTGASGGGNGDGGKWDERVGGKGQQVSGHMAVRPGQKLQINVGGAGQLASGDSGLGGGVNGGGDGAVGLFATGGGGGASDVRIDSFELTDRIVVGGGGGGGSALGIVGGHGGNAGNPSGAKGGGMTDEATRLGGLGGSQTAGGEGGGKGTLGQGVNKGVAGSLGSGGHGVTGTLASGGGGGGYYGGGSGGAESGVQGDPPEDAGGGGGGSSYAALSLTKVEFAAASNIGDGSVTVTFNPTVAPEMAVVANTVRAELASEVAANGSTIDSVTFNIGTNESAVAAGHGADTISTQASPASVNPESDQDPVKVSAGTESLKPESTYFVSISVVSVFGTSIGSVSSFSTASAAAPTQVVAQQSGDGAMKLTWEPPASGSDSSASDYLVAVSNHDSDWEEVPDGSCSKVVSEAECTATGLAANSSYRYQVSALAADGLSYVSAPSEPVLAAGPPSITEESVTKISFDSAEIGLSLEPNSAKTTWGVGILHLGGGTRLNEELGTIAPDATTPAQASYQEGSLQPGSVYGYWGLASNIGGEDTGTKKWFVTKNAPTTKNTIAVGQTCAIVEKSQWIKDEHNPDAWIGHCQQDDAYQNTGFGSIDSNVKVGFHAKYPKDPHPEYQITGCGFLYHGLHGHSDTKTFDDKAGEIADGQGREQHFTVGLGAGHWKQEQSYWKPALNLDVFCYNYSDDPPDFPVQVTVADIEPA